MYPFPGNWRNYLATIFKILHWKPSACTNVLGTSQLQLIGFQPVAQDVQGRPGSLPLGTQPGCFYTGARYYP